MRTRCASLPARLSVLAAFALTSLLAGAPPAAAADLAPGLSSASWYTDSQTSSVIADPAPPKPSTGPVVIPDLPLPAPPDPPGVPPDNPVATVGVGPGQIAVAAVPNGANAEGKPVTRPERESYLEWNLDAVPSDATVTKFSFTVFLATEARNQNAANAELIACLPDAPSLPDTRGAGFDKKPMDDCSNAVAAKRSADATSWSFDVPAYAQTWVSELNSGAAIRNAPTSQPFSIVLDPSKTTAAMSFTPAAPPPSVDPGPVFVPPAPLDPIPFDPGFEGTPGEFIPGELIPGELIPAEEAPAAEPDPVLAAAPPTTATVGPYNGSLAPPWWAWLALAALVAGLVLTSLILGDPIVTPADARARALRRYRFPARPSLLDRRLGQVRLGT